MPILILLINGVIGIIFERRKHLIVGVGIPRADEYAFEERCGVLSCIASKLCKCMQAQTSVLSSSSFALTRRRVYVGTYVYECVGCQRGGKPLISGNSDNLDAYAIITKKTERRRQLTGASANHPFLLPRTIPFSFLFPFKITPTILFRSVLFVQLDSPNRQRPCYY